MELPEQLPPCESGTRRVTERTPGDRVMTWCAREDGTRHGLLVEWFSNGTRRQQKIYRDGREHGPFRGWHPNGALATETQYDDGQLEGPIQSWFSDGRLNYQGKYRRGKRHGPWKEWHENGHPAVEQHYDEGVEDGPCRTWFANGYPKLQGGHSQGKRHGVWKEWVDSGHLTLEAEYREGIQIGAWKVWRSDGRKIEEGQYDAGQRAGFWTFHGEYESKSSGSFLNGKKSGAWTWFRRLDGARNAEGSFEDDRPIGAWTFFGQEQEPFVVHFPESARPDGIEHWLKLNEQLLGVGPVGDACATSLRLLLEWPERELEAAIGLTRYRMASRSDRELELPEEWNALVWQTIQVPWAEALVAPDPPLNATRIERMRRLWGLGRSLTLSEAVLDAPSIRALSQSELLENLSHVWLWNLEIRGDAGEFLASPRLSRLRSLKVSDVELGVQPLLRLAESKQGHRLRELSLSREFLKDAEMARLLRCRGFEQLRHFDLSSPDFGDQCAAALREKTILANLDTLDLEGSDFSSSARKSLASLTFTRLRKLKIDRERCLEDNGRKLVVEDVRAFLRSWAREER